MLSGGVSSGLFRTTNGGTSWTKVSANDEIHNVTGLRKEFNLNLNSGMYLVKFKGSSFETTKRIIIQ